MVSHPPVDDALARAITTLAGTPDHSAGLDARMVTIAKLTAERVAAARYASITALRGRTYTTVALSDDLIQAVDDAQYADNAGPCLQALDTGVPVGVPDIDTMVQWPGFHQAAPRMGLHASVSIPLFAGRGFAVAVLNVYGHDRVEMAPLIAEIELINGNAPDEWPSGRLDVGGLELVAGYAAALDIRAMVQLAISMIRTAAGCSADDAYLTLCIRAGEAGTDLAEAADAVIRGGYPEAPIR